MRIVFAGGVDISRRVLGALLRGGLNVVGVLGYEPNDHGRVSGYARLDDVAKSAAVPYIGITNINSKEVLTALSHWAPDLLFVVGLSQIVTPEVMRMASRGAVGFHPTRLPEGRGRAPVPWMILTQRHGAATFFLMEEGADSGPILSQEQFEIEPDDYASDVHRKIEIAVELAVNKLALDLSRGALRATQQDHSRATYYGRRTPEDGEIDWNRDANEILRLIRATSRPYPGAFSFCGAGKLVIWRARTTDVTNMFGTTGSILSVGGERTLLVQAGRGLIEVTEWHLVNPARGKLDPLRAGARLITSIEYRLAVLEHREG